ncbi:hypothetical protein [Roseomonas sp. BN140053]|uniref:hypothetical protein n=1 Tax=Roseomonas sp. BN140053 TaxID=3391898 RepID=UPI0039E73CD5
MKLPDTSLAELQQAAQRVVQDYDAFLSAGPGPGGHEDAKAFAAFHAAARAALAHLEHLVKLARSITPGDAAGAGESAQLLAQVRAEIAEREAHDDDGDAA